MDAELEEKLGDADWYAMDVGCSRALNNPRWRHHTLSGPTPSHRTVEITKPGTVESVIAVWDDVPIFAIRFYATLGVGDGIAITVSGKGTITRD